MDSVTSTSSASTGARAHRPLEATSRSARDALPERIGARPRQPAATTPDRHARPTPTCVRVRGVGVDQVIFIQQAGRNRHEHICESLELFGAEVLPEFKAEEATRQRRKHEELAPFIEAALARKRWMQPLADDEIPVVRASVAKVQAAGRLALTWSLAPSPPRSANAFSSPMGISRSRRSGAENAWRAGRLSSAGGGTRRGWA